MTDPTKLTTDPPLPPGTPDVDELVGDPVATGAGGPRRAGPDRGSGESRDGDPPTDPADEDVAADTGSVEPPD